MELEPLNIRLLKHQTVARPSQVTASSTSSFGAMAGAGAYGSGGMGAMASAAVNAGSATVNYAASAVASSMAQGPNSIKKLLPEVQTPSGSPDNGSILLLV